MISDGPLFGDGAKLRFDSSNGQIFFLLLPLGDWNWLRFGESIGFVLVN